MGSVLAWVRRAWPFPSMSQDSWLVLAWNSWTGAWVGPCMFFAPASPKEKGYWHSEHVPETFSAFPLREPPISTSLVLVKAELRSRITLAYYRSRGSAWQGGQFYWSNSAHIDFLKFASPTCWVLTHFRAYWQLQVAFLPVEIVFNSAAFWKMWWKMAWHHNDDFVLLSVYVLCMFYYQYIFLLSVNKWKTSKINIF